MSDEPLLSLEDLHASYGESLILRGVNMHVDIGEVVSLVGRNGVGKTTMLRSIVGVLSPHQGRIVLDGENLVSLPEYKTVQRGVSYVPEDRQVFPDLTVAENLKMGNFKSKGGIFDMEEVFEEFPRLQERSNQRASTLSGGEQQMLVIARALLTRTKILLLDEPTEGLAPQIVDDVLDIIFDLKERGVTVLLVEQNVAAAMEVADRHYILESGEIVFQGSNQELESSPDVQEQYLGVGVDTSSW